MRTLFGVISDRLREKFTGEQILRNPYLDRSASPSKNQPIPRDVKGVRLSKPNRRSKK